MIVSFITINLNNIRGLKRTMESILAQTSRDYEWIVIDGGSTDGSRELIEQNAEHIAYWVSEPDKGLYNAMNKGVDVAHGDYLLFLNSGDSLSGPDVVESFVESCPTHDVVYGDPIYVDQEGTEIKRGKSPDFLKLSFFWNGWLNHQGAFISKRCFEVFRYNEENRIASDTELFMQLLYHGYTFKRWEKFVDCFEIGGRSSIVTAEDSREFNAIINRVLPPGIKADYDDIIQNRDVDLYILIKSIIGSKRWVRNAARVALLPFKIFLGRDVSNRK